MPDKDAGFFLSEAKEKHEKAQAWQQESGSLGTRARLYEDELWRCADEPFRGQVVIATKFGLKHDLDKGPGPGVGLDSRPEQIKRVADASLKRLRVEAIDLFYQHRVDPDVPIEDVAGAVRIDPLFGAEEPSRVSGARVTFEPGARTAWHAHPLGQTLIITSGSGRVQREGGPVEEVHPGDVVRFAPGEKHWHGASPITAMSHIAIHEEADDEAAEWFEHVSDEQYQK